MGVFHPVLDKHYRLPVEALSEEETQLLGEMVHFRLAHLRRNRLSAMTRDEYKDLVRRSNQILEKLGHPLFEEGTTQ